MEGRSEHSQSIDVINGTELLARLDPLTNKLERPYIARWKGKLLPEGYVANTEMEFEKDDEMVTAFVDMIVNKNFTEFVS